MTELEYLEAERKKLWEKVLELEDKIDKKTPEYEKEARNASKKASEFRNRCEESKELTASYQNEAKGLLDSIIDFKEETVKLLQEQNELTKESKRLSQSITGYYSSSKRKAELVNDKLATLNRLFNNYNEFVEKVNRLTTIQEEGQDTLLKIEQIKKNVLARKNEIDELYYEIMGYTATDPDTDDETEVEGLKAELARAYKELNENFKKTSKEVTDYKQTTTEEYTRLVIEKDKNFGSIVEGWKIEHQKVLKQIRDLLPEALTAGLSSAYVNKREAEMLEQEKLGEKFTKAIWGLVFVSLIPFAVSIVSLITGKSFQNVIFDIPRVVLSILPLYIPVMWVAYSSDKKMKLSKRLIEEYTHKEVLSKTFEGLSSQIKDLNDNKISEELRIKLLYNILEVSSENPGKLISDYNKSDHPLMDALDKSVKLATAVDKLAKIPGFSKLASTLDKKSKTLLDEKSKKAEEGFNVVDNEEEEIDNIGAASQSINRS